VDVVAGGAGQVPVLAEPVPLELHLEAALEDGVAGELGERALWELVDLPKGVQQGTVRTSRRVERTWVATLYSSNNGS
jgi:hypothetical protein